MQYLVSTFQYQTIVVSTISTNSLGDQLVIAKAAVEAGVKRLVPAELSMDTSSEICLQVAPHDFLKKDIIKHLKQHEDDTSWTGVFYGLCNNCKSGAYSCSVPRDVLYMKSNVLFKKLDKHQLALVELR